SPRQRLRARPRCMSALASSDPRLRRLRFNEQEERFNAEAAKDTQRTRRCLSRAQRATIPARGIDWRFAPAQSLRVLCVPLASFALKRSFLRRKDVVGGLLGQGERACLGKGD